MIADSTNKLPESKLSPSISNTLVSLYNKFYGIKPHLVKNKFKNKIDLAQNRKLDIAQPKHQAIFNKPAASKLQSINSSGVDQSGVGDCFFESALASLANTLPGQKIITNMIKENKNGTYTVTFPGAKSHPVEVSAKDLILNYNNGNANNSALWANIIETAFFKYDHISEYKNNFLESLQSEGVPILGNIMSTDKSLELLTGKSVASDLLSYLDNDNRELTLGKASEFNIARSLNQALNIDHLPVTAGASGGFLTHLGEHNSGPLIGEHVYSVLNFNPKTSIVIVRNPWGDNDGTVFNQPNINKDGITSLTDGKLKMSLATFTKYFTDVNFCGQNPYANDFNNIFYDTIESVKPLESSVKNLVRKHYKQSGHDFYNFIQDQGQLVSDDIYAITDSSERALKFAIAEIADTTYDVGKYLYNEIKPPAKIFIKDLKHDTNSLTSIAIHNFGYY